MKLNLLYFARLREELGVAQEALECQVSTVGELIEMLASRGPVWRAQLLADEPLKIAVDHEMVLPSFVLGRDAEVALFRPVTGG